jgi:hypothetical protein
MQESHQVLIWFFIFGTVSFLFIPSWIVRLAAIILLFCVIGMSLDYEALQASCGALK